MDTALDKFPNHLQFWLLKLAILAGNDDNDETSCAVEKCVEKARNCLGTADRAQLWTNFLQIMSRAGKSEAAYNLLDSATEKG